MSRQRTRQPQVITVYANQVRSIGTPVGAIVADKLRPRRRAPFVPECHRCHMRGLPFDVQLMESGQWAHRCSAIVCPACGGKPPRGAALCLTCQRLARLARHKRP